MTEALDIDRESGAVIVRADKGPDGHRQTSEFDLLFMRCRRDRCPTVAAQVKDGLVDLIVKYQEMKDGQSWYEFVSDYAYSRTQGLIGGGIDAKATSGEATLKWVAYFFLYKFGWHWWFDKVDSGNAKGALEAAKSAAWDVGGVGLEKQLEPFLKKSAAGKGWAQNERLDKWVEETLEEIKLAIGMATGGACIPVPRAMALQALGFPGQVFSCSALCRRTFLTAVHFSKETIKTGV